MAQARDKKRAFTKAQKDAILHQQDYYCAKCHKKLDPRAIHYHHIKPWAYGGRTVVENGAAVCPTCHTLLDHEMRLKNAESKSRQSTKPKLKKEGADPRDALFGGTGILGGSGLFSSENSVSPKKTGKKKSGISNNFGVIGGSSGWGDSGLFGTSKKKSSRKKKDDGWGGLF